MTARPLILVLLLFAAAAAVFAQTVFAQTEDQQPMVEVVVPVVGSVNGVNDVRWRTDLELRNDSPLPVSVVLVLPATADQAVMAFDLAPGEVKRMPDVVGHEFGMSALSPLIVRTSGRHSVSIRATAFAVRGAEVFKPEPIAISYGESLFPTRVLHRLSFNDTFRTNIGLANLGEEDATFTLALQRLEGRNLAVTRLIIPAGALWHLPVQRLFPLITAGDDFSVVVETASRQTYVYASVIENETNTATFVQPGIGTLVSQ